MRVLACHAKWELFRFSSVKVKFLNTALCKITLAAAKVNIVKLLKLTSCQSNSDIILGVGPSLRFLKNGQN